MSGRWLWCHQLRDKPERVPLKGDDVMNERTIAKWILAGYAGGLVAGPMTIGLVWMLSIYVRWIW